jgi:hypothetical protein
MYRDEKKEVKSPASFVWSRRTRIENTRVVWYLV